MDAVSRSVAARTEQVNRQLAETLREHEVTHFVPCTTCGDQVRGESPVCEHCGATLERRRFQRRMDARAGSGRRAGDAARDGRLTSA